MSTPVYRDSVASRVRVLVFRQFSSLYGIFWLTFSPCSAAISETNDMQLGNPRKRTLDVLPHLWLTNVEWR